MTKKTVETISFWLHLIVVCGIIPCTFFCLILALFLALKLI